MNGSVLLDGICFVSPSICVYPHSPHRFEPPLVVLGSDRNSFFWVQVCLLSLPVISVPASSNCAIFQQELPLSSVASSAKLLQGEG